MKQEAGKKKWLLPVIIGLVVVVIAAAVGAIFLLQGDGKDKDGPAKAGSVNKVYWNVDREAFTDPTSGLSIREPEENGSYKIRFALDGEQIELTCSDKKLVNRIDMLPYMGLELDSDGNIVDVIAATSFATLAAENFYIQTAEDNTFVANSSGALNGLQKEFTVTDKAGIYDVSGTGEYVGVPAALDIMDKVVVLTDAEEVVTHVFITERPVDAEVFWRIDPYYGHRDYWDTVKLCTKRVPDKDGVYTILMACNGQQVEVKCKDLEIVNYIDSLSINSQAVGLVFDDEGYAVQYVTPAKAVRGMVKSDQYDVTEISGDSFTLTRMLPGAAQGAVTTIKMAPECKIYDMTGISGPIGTEIQELKINDRLMTLCNAQGEAVQIFVANRILEDVPLYWLIERNFSMSKMNTNRTPDENGWYYLDVTTAGKAPITVKTKDVDLVNQMSRPTVQAMGLVIQNGIVKEYYHYTRLTGGWVQGLGAFVNSANGPILSTITGNGLTSYNMVLTADCQIFNCDPVTASTVGMKITQLQKDDKVAPIRNAKGEVLYVFMYQRKIDAPVYWSADRSYSAVTKETLRTPDAEGYYVYSVTTGGKAPITVKTKDKAIASKMDSYYPQCYGLKIKDGIVQAVYAPGSCTGGGNVANYCHAETWESEDEIFKAVFRANGASVNVTIDDETKYYLVSGTYTKHLGEVTKLKLGDQVAVVTGRDGKAEIVYIVARDVKSKAYWRTAAYEKDAQGWYKYDFLVDGKTVTYKTKDEAVHKEVMSYSIGVGLTLKGDVIQRAFHLVNATDYGSIRGANYDITQIKGNQYTLVRHYPNSTTDGQTYTVTIPSTAKVWDVSSYGSTGKQVKLKVGDRVVPYLDNDGKDVALVFVTNPATREGGVTGLCEHCGKNVYWMPYGPNNTVSGDGHYYLTSNWDRTAIASFASATRLGDKAYDVVIDLNGKTITSTTRVFNVLYDVKLTLLDSSKAKTGTVIGGVEVSGGVGQAGGTILVNYGGDLTILGGTYKLNKDENGYTVNSGGVIFLGGNMPTINGKKEDVTSTSLTIKGGTIIGGEATYGGGIYVSAGDFTMTGGKVVPGKATQGDAICFSSPKKVRIQDAVIEGGIQTGGTNEGYTISGKTQIMKQAGGSAYSLYVAAGTKIDFTGLTNGAKIGITGAGVISTAYGSEAAAQAAANAYFVGDAEGQTVKAEGKALTTGIYKCLYGHTEAQHAASGNTCSEPIRVWTMWTSTTTVPSAAGNYIIANDIVAPARAIIRGVEVVLDLNGHTITNLAEASAISNYSLYMVQYDADQTVGGTLSIVDNAPGKTGKIDFAMEDYKPTDAEVEAWKTEEAVIAAVDAAMAALPENEATPEKRAELLQAEIDKKIAANVTERAKGAVGMLVYVRCGTMNIYGGTIDASACQATSNSNAPIVLGSSTIMSNTINISGGKLLAVKDSTKPVITMNANNTANITGGEIASINVTGDGVTLSGEPVIGKLTLAMGKTLKIGQLGEKADITVSAVDVFTTAFESKAAAEAAAAKLKGDDKIYLTADNCLRVGLPAGVADQKCILGHTYEDHLTISCDKELVTWTELKAAEGQLPTAAGYYRLMTDMVSTGQSTVNHTGTVHIDLNGHTVTSKGTDARQILVNGGATVNLYNFSDKEAKLLYPHSTMTATASNSRGALLFILNGTVNLHNVTLDASALATTPSTAGGTVYMTGASSALNLYDSLLIGTAKPIQGNAIYKAGGALHLEDSEVRGRIFINGSPNGTTLKGVLKLLPGTNTNCFWVLDSAVDIDATQIAAGSEIVIQNGRFVFADNTAAQAAVTSGLLKAGTGRRLVITGNVVYGAAG